MASAVGFHCCLIDSGVRLCNVWLPHINNSRLHGVKRLRTDDEVIEHWSGAANAVPLRVHESSSKDSKEKSESKDLEAGMRIGRGYGTSFERPSA